MLVVSERARVLATVRQDRVWLAILAASYVLCLAASWQRWSDPVVDVGREMNQPLRLAGGELLYSDVRHIYGPLSPYLHAWLFRSVTPSLTPLYADGILSAAIALALLYWLGRQIMSPAAAGAATLNAMSFCVFKPAGNYILPYSYNSLHGAVLGLVTAVILVGALRDSASSNAATEGRAGRLRRMFVLAGFVAGMTTLAKTELGAAAVAAGLTAAVLVSHRDRRSAARLAALFLTPAAALVTVVYALIAARVGWSTLTVDSWLILYTMPPEIRYFNGQISGLARPFESLGRMLIAAAKLGVLAAAIAAISVIIVKRRHGSVRPGGDASTFVVVHPWRVLAVAAGVLIVMASTTVLDANKGPYLAMPLVLGVFLGMLIPTLRAQPNAHTAILIVLTVYALANLARIVMHVRSGGAYASYLLPAALLVFTYLWVGPFAASFRDTRVSQTVRASCLTLLVLAAVLNGVGLAYRYRTRTTGVITTSRGTMITRPEVALAFNEALDYIDRHTSPGDAVAVMPEGTSLDFLSGRRNPLREEIITPGYLDSAGEARAIHQLEDAHTALILVPNRPTKEFGPATFGRDYCQTLMRWIDTRYRVCAVFGPVKDTTLEIGDKPYFIRAYCAR
jgi:hypothetical protein